MNAGDMQYFKTKSTEKQKVKSSISSKKGNTEKQQEKIDFASDVANNPDSFKIMRTIPGSGGRKIKLNSDGTYKIYGKDNSPVPGRTSVSKEDLMKIYPIK